MQTKTTLKWCAITSAIFAALFIYRDEYFLGAIYIGLYIFEMRLYNKKEKE